jgi:hypothetical protein
MGLPKWLKILKIVGLAALSVSPLAPIAGPVAAAIAEAEAMHGKSGAEKLAHVVDLATDAAIIAQALGKPVDGQMPIDPEQFRKIAAVAISAAVDATNVVHDADEPVVV